MAVVPQLRVGEGVRAVAAHLAEGAAKLPLMMAIVVEKSAVDLNSLTQQNASGRPGPNVITGDYRGSWRVQPEASGIGEVSFSSGTDRAQANRLEHGYVGTDSAGRHYDQPPFPHHGPAVNVIEPIFYAAMAKIADQATSW